MLYIYKSKEKFFVHEFLNYGPKELFEVADVLAQCLANTTKTDVTYCQASKMGIQTLNQYNETKSFSMPEKYSKVVTMEEGMEKVKARLMTQFDCCI